MSPSPPPSPDLIAALGRRVEERAGPAYYVGGCVRDLLRGEASKDVDFAVSGSPWEAGRALREALGGHLFWLREEEQVARLLLPQHAGLQVDLNPLLEGDVEADLRRRDLTINALALPALQGLRLPAAGLLDPTGGLADLEAGLVRFAAPTAPQQDPLRTLRAFRFRWKLGFRFAPGTLDLAREAVPRLAGVSGERIRDELFQLLAVPEAARPLAEVLALGAGPYLTGREADYSACASAVAAVEARLADAGADLAEILEREPTAGRRRREVLLWAAALGAATPPVAPAAVQRLALSNDERALIVRGLGHAAAAANLLARWPAPPLERFRFCRDAGNAAPEAVLLAEGPDGPRAELLAEALERLLRPLPPLLTGDQVIRELGVTPGPALGRALRQVEEARAAGEVGTVAEALDLARRLLSD